MRRVCADACFLIALYHERDGFHAIARQWFADLFENTLNRLIVPWPALYETVSTRMVRSPRRVERMYTEWRNLRANQRLDLLDDGPFRDGAIDGCFAEPAKGARRYRALSLSDRVIREMLADTGTRIDVFLTFNASDFIDVCQKFRREMLPATSRA